MVWTVYTDPHDVGKGPQTWELAKTLYENLKEMGEEAELKECRPRPFLVTESSSKEYLSQVDIVLAKEGRIKLLCEIERKQPFSKSNNG